MNYGRRPRKDPLLEKWPSLTPVDDQQLEQYGIMGLNRENIGGGISDEAYRLKRSD
ncbi:hypothetical protein [Paenibacillus sp. Soil724D2]|uniref:hypothetical protein n=1 Tax=Paenibacillus sp. (strain Soil724D2) TaxID=1736392 RepID=UPI0012E3B73F|nr:hypothetical protein [Paenibacillus sp. Soil724D2]